MQFETSKYLLAYKNAFANIDMTQKSNGSKKYNLFMKQYTADMFVVPFSPESRIIPAESNYSTFNAGKTISFRVPKDNLTCLGKIFMHFTQPTIGGTASTINSAGLLGSIKNYYIRNAQKENLMEFTKHEQNLIMYDLLDINERARIDRLNDRTISIFSAGDKYASCEMYVPWARHLSDMIPLDMLVKSEEIYLEFELETLANYATNGGGGGVVALPEFQLEMEFYHFDKDTFNAITKIHNRKHLVTLFERKAKFVDDAFTTEKDTSTKLDKHNIKSLFLTCGLTSDRDGINWLTRKDPTTILKQFWISSGGSDIAYCKNAFPMYRLLRKRHEKLTKNDITLNIIPIDFTLSVHKYTNQTGRLALSSIDDPYLYVKREFAAGTNYVDAVGFIEGYLKLDEGKLKIVKI